MFFGVGVGFLVEMDFGFGGELVVVCGGYGE